jgi:glycosyltransferase involved in cell wall biosynthesis
MKGLFAWVGFRTSVVEYQVEARLTGASKFNSWKLWNFALEGITSFSNVPLRIWTYLGFLIAMSALVYGIYVIVKTMVFGVDLPGYPSLLVSVLFLGGVQLISIGVLGEYIGRIYLETKQRPVYLVRKEY